MSKLSQPIDEYIDDISRLVPINRLPKSCLKIILDNCVVREFEPDSTVYRQGDEDDDLYYLIDGTVSLYWRDEKLKQIKSGSAAAKRAFDRPGKKRHSIKAQTTVTIAVFPSFIVEHEMRKAGLVGEKSNLEVSDIASEKSSNWMIRMLQSALFSQLPATTIQNIFSRMERYPVKADQRVVVQGEPGDYYYVIEQGYCEVTRQIPGNKRDIYLADLKPGDGFGEEALVANATRGATVTMLVDGVLMRLPKSEFQALIQTPLLKPISISNAIKAIQQEARWIDIRYPEQFNATPMRYSENIPFNVIRLHARQLDKEYEYIVCSDSQDQSAVAAFLLLERGVTVRYLEGTVGEALEQLPSELQAAVAADEKSTNFDAQHDTDRPLDNRSLVERTTEELTVSSDEAVQRLESTIEKIDRVYVDREHDLETRQAVSPDRYAQTATGQRLADLIDDMDRSQQILNNGTTGAEDELPSHTEVLDMDVTGGPNPVEHLSKTSNPNILLVNTNVPLPVEVDLIGDEVEELNLNDDSLAMMIREFEKRIRGQLAEQLGDHTAKLEARYEHKLGRVQRAAAIEVKKRQLAYKQKVDLHYKKKELSLRKHYQKLMALANKVTAQKAQLEDAKRQFEDKLQAANALYKEVEEMRTSLKDHLNAEIEINAMAQRRHSRDDVSS